MRISDWSSDVCSSDLLAVHIGSQLTEIAPYRLAFERLIALYKELRAAGVPLKRLDFGGGIGISYRHEPLTGAAGGEAVGEADARVTAYAEMVRELVQGPEGQIGRASCRERVCQYV